MQANAPAQATSYRIGVVLYGVLAAAGILILGLAVAATWLSVERDYRMACIVSAAAMLPASFGLVSLASTALRHQLRPSPLAPVRDRLRLAPTLGIRLGLVVTLVGLTSSIAAFSLVRPMGTGWWIGLGSCGS